MTREECVLMAAVSDVTKQTAAFALEFVEGDMPPARQLVFARQLALVAHQLMEHAQQRLDTAETGAADRAIAVAPVRRELTAGGTAPPVPVNGDRARVPRQLGTDHADGPLPAAGLVAPFEGVVG